MFSCRANELLERQPVNLNFLPTQALDLLRKEESGGPLQHTRHSFGIR